MRKFIFSTIVLLAITVGAKADNLAVANIGVQPGKTATVSVTLNTADETYRAVLFTLSLPEGVTVVDDEIGEPVTSVDALVAAVGYSVTANHLENGLVRFAVVSTSGQEVIPTENALFSFTIMADECLTPGIVLTASLQSIELTDAYKVDHHPENVSFSIVIDEVRTILDENSTSLPEAVDGVDVRVKRSIKANQWSTICLPFAMTEAQTKAAFGDDVQIADFNDYEYDEVADAINLKFKSASEMEANHPYMIKVSSPITEFTVDNVDIDPQEAIVDFDTSRRKNKPRQFVGTYVAGTVLDWGMLFLSENRFWYSTGNTKMKAFRGYFNFNDLLFDFADNYESRIAMLFDDEATSIESHRLPTTDNGSYYTLDGRRVKETSLQPGVYVKNGQKVVVR